MNNWNINPINCLARPASVPLVTAVNHTEKKRGLIMHRQSIKTSMVRNSTRSGTRARGLILISLTLASLALSREAHAQAQTCPSLCDDSTGNTAMGFFSLYPGNLTTGMSNTAIGFYALFGTTSGSANTATGFEALAGNTTGNYNTATGYSALSVGNGSYNTATGYAALSGGSGSYNTATGFGALDGNTADGNTATGYDALLYNRTGTQNVATGLGALYYNQVGNYNTATGLGALHQNTQGSNNTAHGINVLYYNTASNNTGYGANALENNTGGTNNTATGYDALLHNSTASNNTADGFQALLNNTGSNNIALGSNAGMSLTTGSNNIDIGAPGTAGDANTIRIGKSGTQQKAFIAGISGKTVASSVPVFINTSGQLGTVQSSVRFKDDIKPMENASEALLKLKPVTFRYKEELDPDKIPQFGLVAEDVEKVNPDLVVRDEQGKLMSVRYDAVNVMLLNEFLKEHRKVKEQEGTITRLKSSFVKQEATISKLESTFARQNKEFQSTISQQQKEIEALTMGLHRINSWAEVTKSTPRLVADGH